MNIKPIGVEEWLNELETSATLDIAQSTIASLTTDEILALADDEQGGPGMGARAFYDELGSKKQNYGWMRVRRISSKRWPHFTRVWTGAASIPITCCR